MDNIKTTNMSLTVDNNTSTTHVTTASDHANISNIELDEIGDLALLEIETDGIVGLDEGIGVADGAAVVGDDVWDALGTDSDALDFAELVGSLLRSDAVDGETALDVVKNTEVLARLLDGYYIFLELIQSSLNANSRQITHLGNQ